MKFQGERTFTLPREALFAKLADAGFLIACVPDSQSVGSASAERATCIVKPGFSFIRGTLDVELQRVESQEPARLSYHVLSKGVGSSAEVTTTMDLDSIESGTKVSWTGEVTKLGGLLKMAPNALLQAAAKKVIEDVWTGIASRLAS